MLMTARCTSRSHFAFFLLSLMLLEASCGNGSSTPAPDPLVVEAGATSQGIVEATPSVSVEVTLSRPSDVEIEIPFAVTGSASLGADFSVSASPLVIAIGEVTAAIDIDLVNDVLDEHDETIIVLLSTPSSGSLGDATSHTTTILDDDDPPIVMLTGADSATEGGERLSLRLELSTVSGREVILPFALAGSATVGADYEVSQNPLRIQPGSEATTLVVEPRDDDECELPEEIEISFTDPINATLESGSEQHAVLLNDNDNFNAVSISVTNEAVWEINRPIAIEFSLDVDFSSVSNNSIQIAGPDGVPATGTFSLSDPRTVVFQPRCPSSEDLSDAGLAPATRYELRLPTLLDGGVSVRGTNGSSLCSSVSLNFQTPTTLHPTELFFDTTPGPPIPIIRPQGSTDLNASHIEVGGNPDERIYFEIQPDSSLTLSDPSFLAGLNLYSNPETGDAVVIEFNQAILPDSTNLSDQRIGLQFRASQGIWQRLATRVELLANCTETGARVRLEPMSIMPVDSLIRVAIYPGFRDLVGQTLLLQIDNFAFFATEQPVFSSLNPPENLGDELFEGFIDSALEDTDFLTATPIAEWGGGQLTATFNFEGTGGPGGNFDWVVSNGELLFFDTTATVIIGGPGGSPVSIQNAVNGVVDVRDLIIEAGGEIRVQGPNPLRIHATGNVIIDGRLDVSGFNARDVATLNTGNQVEVGGAGVAAGGRGGNASEVIDNSTPRGGTGQGPFGALNAGGFGGESGFAPKSMGKDARRPGGGGGGRFASDARMLADFDGDTMPDNPGEEAQAGLDGHPQSRGAESGLSPARGGQPGNGPFMDAREDNDFFGARVVPDGMGGIAEIIRGELPRILAGFGGGGGGEAVPSDQFPAPNWNPGSDEKGGAGGGGGGALRIRALGDITIGQSGEVLARGGRGATGENTLFLDHVGGTGGSASGGHVVLESAGRIVFSGTSAPQDRIDASGGPTVIGPLADIPNNISYGGTGSGGVIQLHVPNPLDPVGILNTDEIQVPLLVLDATVETTLDHLMSPVGYVLVPTFGARSKARSKWISLGEASFNPDSGGPPDLVRFLFNGITGDAAGRVHDRNMDGLVDELAPLIDEILTGSSALSLDASGLALTFTRDALTNLVSGTTQPNETGAGVPNDLLLRTPALLKNFTLRLSESGNPPNFQDSDVTSAVYDEGTIGIGDEALTLTVAVQPDDMSTMNDFVSSVAVTRVALIPRFFSINTAGQPDVLPTTSTVSIRFQAARNDGTGNPDELNPLVDFTGDISRFNQQLPGEIQFFRFEVEFDLTGGGGTLSSNTQPIALDFLRIPFLF